MKPFLILQINQTQIRNFPPQNHANNLQNAVTAASSTHLSLQSACLSPELIYSVFTNKIRLTNAIKWNGFNDLCLCNRQTAI